MPVLAAIFVAFATLLGSLWLFDRTETTTGPCAARRNGLGTSIGICAQSERPTWVIPATVAFGIVGVSVAVFVGRRGVDGPP
jgi:hypothetical protein